MLATKTVTQTVLVVRRMIDISRETKVRILRVRLRTGDTAEAEGGGDTPAVLLLGDGGTGAMLNENVLIPFLQFLN